jgi:7,8-dihydro-6-hydroxymethylpterin-pyrophosphokinase
MEQAWQQRKFIHIGRVNSQRRYRHFHRLARRLDIDIVSCDGTTARFHPNQALRRLTAVMNEKES